MNPLKPDVPIITMDDRIAFRHSEGNDIVRNPKLSTIDYPMKKSLFLIMNGLGNRSIIPFWTTNWLETGQWMEQPSSGAK
jgi:hypothetical protein